MQAAALTISPSKIRSFHAGVSAGFNRAPMIRNYLAGTEIYAQGEQAGELFVIEFGAVRIHRLLADGRRQVIAFHLAGETFGFEAGGTRTFFAEAITATGIRPLGAAANDGGAPDLMALALRGLLKAQEHLLVIGRQCARERVAAFLLDMADRQGDDARIELPMPRIDIADYLGLTIETVSRTFAKLRAQGVIELRGTRNVALKRRDVLTELCR
jgi:CRP/FNR family nitrogen fixation transcriptional regulator